MGTLNVMYMIYRTGPCINQNDDQYTCSVNLMGCIIIINSVYNHNIILMPTEGIIKNYWVAYYGYNYDFELGKL